MNTALNQDDFSNHFDDLSIGDQAPQISSPDKLETITNTIRTLSGKNDIIEKRLFAVEFKGCQMEQSMASIANDSISNYKELANTFSNSIESMKAAILTEIKNQNETISNALNACVHELQLIRQTLDNKKIIESREIKVVEEESSVEGEDEKKKSNRKLNSETGSFITIYFDVGVYVPYSALRKQLRRHGVQSSLILNMYYRKGGIVEIVTYKTSSDELENDLDRISTWSRVDDYDPVLGCMDAKDVKKSDLQSREVKSLICSYFTTVHAAILTSNGSETLKSYYKSKAFEICDDFLKGTCVSSSGLDLEALWQSSSQN
ncbi:hypothetical protein ROZALSC1DRAFT_26525 [Rozella allomycis CSF55]|uniref:Uncharacterized protein n=1 Tax=Rozella allomycis (strain CSF55) TaxID=988480 RepID=A0A075B1N0_ROZAC|nr:hypothetical protein O9G_003319 [Rozella allomycis CSF55]RKP22100.1 hypothetical protein ROZALSC1DRAFT_26525 [Rozella allomycis CSF55]|eukprot:EPZ36448.1 hypothetical protein O9G_003319 [Rozella allomycis CSF55]